MHEITVIEEISLCRCSNLGGFPIWIIILGFISPILLVVNSATNLLIYCVFGSMFRKVLSTYVNCGKHGKHDTEQEVSRIKKLEGKLNTIIFLESGKHYQTFKN